MKSSGSPIRSQDCAVPLSGSHRSLTSTPTRPRNRRAANATTARLDGSSHCTSSTATSTGVSAARTSTDGDQRRRHHPLIGDVTVGSGPQQHPVDGQALQVWQLVDRGRVRRRRASLRRRRRPVPSRPHRPARRAPGTRARVPARRRPTTALVLPMPASPSMIRLAGPDFGGRQEVRDGTLFGHSANSTSVHGLDDCRVRSTASS